MELRTAKDVVVRRPPGENTPTVTVIAGGRDKGPDVGVARVSAGPPDFIAATRQWPESIELNLS